VGFFGFVPAELASITKGSRDYRVETDLRGTARRMVAKLRSEGCDLIVLLSHAGIYADRDVAASVEGIHAILGGHTHTLLERGELIEGPNGWRTLIGQAGAMDRWLGKMVVTVRDGRLDPDRSGWSVLELTADVPADPRMALFLEPYEHRLDRELNVPVGTLPEPADATKAVVRARESALGDFIAQAFRWKADARIGLINGGSIRGDRIYPAGPFSYRTLYEIMPYGNTLVRGTLTGAELRQVLELSASALPFPGDGYDAAVRTPTGGFLQVAGLRFAIDPHRRPARVDNAGNISFPGERVSDVRVETAPGVWAPLSAGERYTLVTNDWIGTGGDKYVFLGNILKGTGRNLQLGDADSLAEYVRAVGLGLSTDGRILIRE
jgi:5'-nucleotidase